MLADIPTDDSQMQTCQSILANLVFILLDSYILALMWIRNSPSLWNGWVPFHYGCINYGPLRSIHDRQVYQRLLSPKRDTLSQNTSGWEVTAGRDSLSTCFARCWSHWETKCWRSGVRSSRDLILCPYGCSAAKFPKLRAYAYFVLLFKQGKTCQVCWKQVLYEGVNANSFIWIASHF